MQSISSTDPLSSQIAELREASRQVVRLLGLLQRCWPLENQSATQCHILLELERHGRLTVAELADLLRLDRSTTSRALSRLRRQGLAEEARAAADQRQKPVRLSREGRRAVAKIHSLADEQVRSALELLRSEERRTVVDGMSLYARGLDRSRRLQGIEIRAIRRRDDARIEAVIRRVLIEFGANGAGFSAADSAIGRMYDTFSGPRSAYWVVEDDGDLLGGAGFGPLAGGEDDVCELRKMYLLPEVRGLGLGERLLRTCLEAARERGYRRCYLETLRHMAAARRLYEQHGFELLEAPLGSTGHSFCNTWYARELG